MATPKLPHKIGFSILAIAVGLFAMGFIYVYVTDKTPSSKSETKPATSSYKPLAAPPKPNPNAALGVSIESLDTPVAAGGSTSLTIQTSGDAICSLLLSYGTVKATDPALSPQTANTYGIVTWTWTVPINASVGNWPVKVTCHNLSKSAVVVGNLQVTNG